MDIIIFLIGCIMGFGGIIVSMYQVTVKKSKKFDFWTIFMWACIGVAWMLLAIANFIR